MFLGLGTMENNKLPLPAEGIRLPPGSYTQAGIHDQCGRPT